MRAFGPQRRPAGQAVRKSPALSTPTSARRNVARRAAAAEEVRLQPAKSGHTKVPTRTYELPNGKTAQVMADDYGFRTGSSRLYDEHYGEVPKGIFYMAFENFAHEWKQMRKMFVKDEFKPIFQAKEEKTLLSKVTSFFGKGTVGFFRAADKALVGSNALQPVEQLDFQDADDEMTTGEVKDRLRQLKLNAHAVSAKENERFKVNPPDSPWYIKLPYFALCIILDLVYEGRPIQRFWVLEEVARMPYFAYLSVLHLYESLGWWRAGAALRKVHFAEEWNELHHLQIMESLGGDNAWVDRFVAQHASLAYYWGVVLLYMLSPKHAYEFSELVEGHAVDTYEVFTEQNKEILQTLPPPRVAVEYYMGSDPYMFQEFLVSEGAKCRAPKCDSLLDTFHNIIDDEIEHKKTMKACQSPEEVARNIAESKDIVCETDI